MSKLHPNPIIHALIQHLENVPRPRAADFDGIESWSKALTAHDHIEGAVAALTALPYDFVLNIPDEPTGRSRVLLRAAYDLLVRNNSGPYVQSAADTVVHYDEANCDGLCLREDILIHLGLEADTQPVPLAAES